MLRIDADLDYFTDLLPALLVFSLGLAPTVAPLTATVLADADESNAGIASGVNNAIARVAGLLAVAAIGAVVSAQFNSSLDESLAGQPVAPDQAAVDRGAHGDARATRSCGGRQPRRRRGGVRVDQAFHVGIGIAAALVALGGVLGLAGIRNPRRAVALRGLPRRPVRRPADRRGPRAPALERAAGAAAGAVECSDGARPHLSSDRSSPDRLQMVTTRSRGRRLRVDEDDGMTGHTHGLLPCELHAHTTWSDGSQTIGQIVDTYGHARFDVLCITDHVVRPDDPLCGSDDGPLHVHAGNYDAYLAAIEIEAARARVQYDMLVLPGLELTYNDLDPRVGAHAVAVGLERFVGVGDGIERALRDARGSRRGAHRSASLSPRGGSDRAANDGALRDGLAGARAARRSLGADQPPRRLRVGGARRTARRSRPATRTSPATS